jgi:hypothetical protein
MGPTVTSQKDNLLAFKDMMPLGTGEWAQRVPSGNIVPTGHDDASIAAAQINGGLSDDKYGLSGITSLSWTTRTNPDSGEKSTHEKSKSTATGIE